MDDRIREQARPQLRLLKARASRGVTLSARTTPVHESGQLEGWELIIDPPRPAIFAAGAAAILMTIDRVLQWPRTT